MNMIRYRDKVLFISWPIVSSIVTPFNMTLLMSPSVTTPNIDPLSSMIIAKPLFSVYIAVSLKPSNIVLIDVSLLNVIF